MMTFVFGFFSIYVILLGLWILLKCSRRLFEKIENVFEKLKSTICAIIFTLLSFVFAIFYANLAMIGGEMIISALLCAIFLVFSWILTEKMYQIMSGEEKDCEERSKLLTKTDKNVCNLLALVGMIISSIVLGIENACADYIVLLSIAISIWIGAYVPISEIYMGKGIKKIASAVIGEFRTEKKSIWLTSSACVALIIFLISQNAVAQKFITFIETFGTGMAMGSIVMIILALLSVLKKSK